MVCPKCGAIINVGDNFCEECGASLKQTSSGNSNVGDFPKSKIVVYDKNLAAATNIGRKHPKNEDDGTALRLPNGDKLLIVADGVSSSFSARSASELTIDVIKERLANAEGNPRELIKAAVCEADNAVKELPYENREDGIYGPETTVVVALVKDNTATIGWVGDSRAYVINGNEQKLLTRDDSWIEMVVAEGSMTREQASIDRRAHYVTQVLGMHDQEVEIHTLEYNLKFGDMLLLCSDGLWNYFQGENELQKVITACGINSEAIFTCEHLVNLANSAGGHDNITVSLLRIE